MSALQTQIIDIPFTGGLDCTKLHNFLGYELSTPAQGLLRMKGN